jgi:hypothetical protein
MIAACPFCAQRWSSLDHVKFLSGGVRCTHCQKYVSIEEGSDMAKAVLPLLKDYQARVKGRILAAEKKAVKKNV